VNPGDASAQIKVWFETTTFEVDFENTPEKFPGRHARMEKDQSPRSEDGLRVRAVEIEEELPRKPKSRKALLRRTAKFLRRPFSRQKDSPSPWHKLVRNALYLLTAAVILAVVAVVIYHSLFFDLVRRLSPPKLSITGLTQIVNSWVEPGTLTPAPPSWLPNFSRDIEPKAIHSHNNYWRPVPLVDALSLGITGVEADCHSINGELYVAHTNSSLVPNRTLRSLYLDPLTTILENQNKGSDLAPSAGINGVWDVDPSRGLVLMTDLKTEGFSTLEVLYGVHQCERFINWTSISSNLTNYIVYFMNSTFCEFNYCIPKTA